MNPHSEQFQQFQTLWERFLEGELGQGDSATLQELLRGQEELQQIAIDQYELHRLLGFLMKESPAQSESFIQETMQKLQERSEKIDESEFSAQTMKRLKDLLATTSKSSSSSPLMESRSLLKSKFAVLSGWVTAAVAIVALVIVWNQPASDANALGSSVADQESLNSVPVDGVRFSRVARAQFFGELSPAVDSNVPLGKTFCLTSGMVELLFPTGAVAILEGPAVFRARDRESLEVDTGLCSVHAPEGAEGFRVLTPDASVVDRGTRFSVHVTEFNETEVHVVEGAADLYQKQTLQSEQGRVPSIQELHLKERQAARVQTTAEFKAAPMTFRADQYRKTLPDRVVSYEASRNSDGGVDFLQSVTVQRNGQERTYSVEELIPVELIWFQAREISRDGHFIGRETLSENRLEYFSDTSLATGVINPGGSATPLKSDPVLKFEPEKGVSGTPGLAFQFQRPVKNQPGPDIVFFEIHPISSPTNGDAFHISPVRFSKGLRTHSVTQYDLSLLSPEALPVTQMFAHNLLNQQIRSLDLLQSESTVGRPVRLKYRALAVAIDLSDLGYGPDDEVDALFIQDAEDGEGRVDPVFIGGLP